MELAALRPRLPRAVIDNATTPSITSPDSRNVLEEQDNAWRHLHQVPVLVEVSTPPSSETAVSASMATVTEMSSSSLVTGPPVVGRA